MRTAFQRRVKEALNNPALQTALDINADRSIVAWDQAFARLPDAPQLLQRARQIRQHTLANLDQHLAEFVQNASANGFQVHRAVDAAEACRIAVEIIQRHGLGPIVKSKTMVSEEIRLNDALERAGMEVIETDLGEFIVQLRNEPPAHLIAPAVHLRREDVAETFAEKLGMAYSTDVEAMNEVARNTLQHAFLRAPVGISGVNFGVAETGSICVLTNEGNGRKVTIMPPVHIALMGLERVVPTLDDLALLLQVLPRAGTGQAQTSYVSLLQRPRRDTDPDGPEARHLILIDNGRSRLAQTWLAEVLACVRCGACLNVCPVYREIGGHAYDSVYSGPIGSVVSPGLFGMREYGHLAKASTLCGACVEACPVQIDLPKLLLRVRDEYRRRVRQPRVYRWAIRLYAWVMERPGRYHPVQWITSRVMRMLPGRGGWIRGVPWILSGWMASREFPRFTDRPFHRRVGDLKVEPAEERGISQRVDLPREGWEGGARDTDEITRFQAALEEVDGEFIRCSRAQVVERVVERVRAMGIRSVLCWGDVGDEVGRVVERLEREGVEMTEPWVPRGDKLERQRALERFDEVEAGITGAVAGIAETGTVILPGGEGRAQLSSMLPEVHFVLLSAEAIVPTLAEWLSEGGKSVVRSSSSLVLVTGPSLTADIEMTLTVGVHGPREVVVFCMDGDG